MIVEVNEKHVKLRLILFALFFIVAVVAFTVGVVNMGRKAPGYHLVEAKADPEALLYNRGVVYRYYLDGSSNSIKKGIRELEAVYTPVLGAAYKQLDPNGTYMGAVGIGTINSHLGEVVSVSSRLYGILKDAYSKTMENRGFNMFAGALFSEWKSIQILDDPSAFDPAGNASQAHRLSEIAAVVGDVSNFRLEFLDDESHKVRLSVSDSYLRFCADHEIDAPIMDLNNMQDAYMLSWLSEEMAGRGYGQGYFSTPGGTVVSTGGAGVLGYDMYTLQDGERVKYGSLDLEGGSPFSATTFTADGFGSHWGYSLEVGGRTLYRNLFFDVRTGEMRGVLLSANIIGIGCGVDACENDGSGVGGAADVGRSYGVGAVMGGGVHAGDDVPTISDAGFANAAVLGTDVVSNAYHMIMLNTLSSDSDVRGYVSDLERCGYLVSYALQSEAK